MTLVGLIILHVDDLLLSVNMRDQEAVQVLQKIKTAFDFGKWQELKEKEDIIYCGERIAKKGETVSLDFEGYMKKVVRVTIQKRKKRSGFPDTSRGVQSTSSHRCFAMASRPGVSLPECIDFVDSIQHQQGNS